MIVHKCDICGKEMGIWLTVKVDFDAQYANTNVGDLLNLRGVKEICKDCYLRIRLPNGIQIKDLYSQDLQRA